jgi:hypothetical protein
MAMYYLLAMPNPVKRRDGEPKLGAYPGKETG